MSIVRGAVTNLHLNIVIFLRNLGGFELIQDPPVSRNFCFNSWANLSPSIFNINTIKKEMQAN